MNNQMPMAVWRAGMDKIEAAAMIVKSATIYQTELSLMSEMISSAQRAGTKATSASEYPPGDARA